MTESMEQVIGAVVRQNRPADVRWVAEFIAYIAGMPSAISSADPRAVPAATWRAWEVAGGEASERRLREIVAAFPGGWDGRSFLALRRVAAN